MNARHLVLLAGACVAAVAIGSVSMASPPTLEYVFGRDTRLGADGHYHGVPGCNGERLSTTTPNSPSIDNNGNILTRCELDTASANGSTAVTGTRFIVLYGGPAGSANPIHLVARDGGVYGSGDWAHLPNVNSWVTNSLTNNKGLQDTPIMTPGGTIFVNALLNGIGATSSNNGSLWTGHDGSLAQVVQNGVIPTGGVAPGTGGAQWNTTYSNFGDPLTPWTLGRAHSNDAGQVAFPAVLTGGNVIPNASPLASPNGKGLFIGTPGNITLVARTGWGSQDAATNPDGVQLRFETPAGITTDATGLTLSNHPPYNDLFSQGVSLNHEGEVAFIAPLVNGVAGVSTENDSCVWTNMGGTLRAVAREGTPTPWDGTLYFTDTQSMGTPFTPLAQSMSRNRSYFCLATVFGTNVTIGTNDQVLAKYHWDAATSTGNWTPLIRGGDPCPLVSGAHWGVIGTSTRALSNDGVLVGAWLAQDGVSITADNDECLVVMDAAGTPKLVAREGTLVSNFGHPANLGFGLPADATFIGGFASYSSICANANGQVLFSTGFNGTGVVHSPVPPATPNPYANDGGLFLWDPVEGLMLLARAGTSNGTPTGTILTPMTFNGVTGVPTGFITSGAVTGEGTETGLTDNGWLTFRAQDTSGANNNLYRAHYMSVSPYCSADFNHDGDVGTDADIEAFFACLGGNCCAACGSADFNGDGDVGTDSDIESFFRVLGGGAC
jgi:hypothetical protein